MDLGERRELMNGFGNGLSVAFEIALAPAVFAGLGWLVDRWLGLFPIFTIALMTFGVVGVFTKMWFAYEGRMREYEKNAVWAPRAPESTQEQRA